MSGVRTPGANHPGRSIATARLPVPARTEPVVVVAEIELDGEIDATVNCAVQCTNPFLDAVLDVVQDVRAAGHDVLADGGHSVQN